MDSSNCKATICVVTNWRTVDPIQEFKTKITHSGYFPIFTELLGIVDECRNLIVHYKSCLKIDFLSVRLKTGPLCGVL